MVTSAPHSNIALTPVQSSRLAALAFDGDDFALYVRFHPTKKSPAGKVYRYENVSEEIFDDLMRAESMGSFFAENIIKRADAYPFTCIDDGTGEIVQQSEPAPEDVSQNIQEIPDDEAGLKSLALETRAEATALSITTAEECEAASIEVLRVRAQRKLAIEKVNRIKIPATQAWQAACALFNEVDGRYAEAERYLDDGIIAYRAAERRRAQAEQEAHRLRIEAENRELERLQKEEHEKQVAAAKAEADARAKELAEIDAKNAEARGVPAAIVEQIRENPLPIAARHVPAPTFFRMSTPAPIVQHNIPSVKGLAYNTEWDYEIENEGMIPLTHEFYSVDRKKINAKVQAMKSNTNIPGVRVYSKEVPVKRLGRR